MGGQIHKIKLLKSPSTVRTLISPIIIIKLATKVGYTIRKFYINHLILDKGTLFLEHLAIGLKQQTPEMLTY
jgi:hypothetical protein